MCLCVIITRNSNLPVSLTVLLLTKVSTIAKKNKMKGHLSKDKELSGFVNQEASNQDDASKKKNINSKTTPAKKK